jgi:hypothetical protein
MHTRINFSTLLNSCRDKKSPLKISLENPFSQIVSLPSSCWAIRWNFSRILQKFDLRVVFEVIDIELDASPGVLVVRVLGGLEYFFFAVVLETCILLTPLGPVNESRFVIFISLLGTGISFGGKFLIVYSRLARM